MKNIENTVYYLIEFRIIYCISTLKDIMVNKKACKQYDFLS